MKIECLEQEVCPDWDAFVSKSENGSVYHTMSWRSVVKEAFDKECFYLMARGIGGDVIGVLPVMRLKSLLFGDFLISLPYVNYGGPLSQDENVDNALISQVISIAREKRISHLELREVAARAPTWPCRTDKVAMLLPLPECEKELFKSIGSKLRAQIKRPSKEGVTARVGGVELLPDFYSVFCRNMRDLGTPVYPLRFFELVCTRLDAMARVVCVHQGDKAVAAGILIGFKDTIEMPWASSIREFNRIGVNMLLYWEAMRFAIDNKFTRFDFGRSTRDGGTYRFKKQWGASPEQLYWHYWLSDGRSMPALSPNNPKFRLAIRMWQSLPVPVANALGPLIVKDLP